VASSSGADDAADASAVVAAVGFVIFWCFVSVPSPSFSIVISPLPFFFFFRSPF
jgi:hypothetical protein